jgi:DHA1 family multidrug resistance protein-like MFS transporter
MTEAARQGRPPSWQGTVNIVAATQVVTLIGFNFSFPFLPLFIQELGVHDRSELALWTGVAIGGSGLTMALASPVWGLLADRFGRKAMLARSQMAGVLILAVQSAVTNVGQLVAVRIANGALTGSQTAGVMLLAGLVPRERTGFSLGLLSTAVQVGNLIGPVLGGLAVLAFGLRGSFLLGALLLAGCTLVTVLFVDEGHRPRRDDLPVGVRGSVRDVFVPFSWAGLRGVLVAGPTFHVVLSGTAGVMAIYVQDLARPSWLSLELAVGLAFALSAVSAGIAMPLLGSRADRRDPRRQLMVSLALIAVFLVPQVIVPNVLVFLLGRLIGGFGIAGATSAIAVLTRMGARPGAEGRAFGALASAQNLGWGIGPILGSAVAAVVGIPTLYVASAAALLALLVVVANNAAWFARRSIPPDVAVLPTVGAEPAD